VTTASGRSDIAAALVSVVVQTSGCAARTLLRMATSVYTESLRRAAAELGGAEKLAAYLDVPLLTVEHWLSGATRPPLSAFLRAVDFITSRNAPPYARG
jgi:hypothetical protein